jgi:hypothetical protein
MRLSSLSGNTLQWEPQIRAGTIIGITSRFVRSVRSHRSLSIHSSTNFPCTNSTEEGHSSPWSSMKGRDKIGWGVSMGFKHVKMKSWRTQKETWRSLFPTVIVDTDRWRRGQMWFSWEQKIVTTALLTAPCVKRSWHWYNVVNLISEKNIYIYICFYELEASLN